MFWLYCTKTIKSSQFIEILKVKTTSIYRNVKSQDHFSVTFRIRKNGYASKLELMIVTLERINEPK